MSRSGVDAYKAFLSDLLGWLKQQRVHHPQWHNLVSSGRCVYKPWVIGFATPKPIYVGFHTGAYHDPDGDRLDKMLSVEINKNSLPNITLHQWQAALTDVEGNTGLGKQYFYIVRQWGRGQKPEDYASLSNPHRKQKLFIWIREVLIHFLRLCPFHLDG